MCSVLAAWSRKTFIRVGSRDVDLTARGAAVGRVDRVGFRKHTPSPGTPGEGGGEGLRDLRFEISDLRFQIPDPHPDPHPEYRERKKAASPAPMTVTRTYIRAVGFFRDDARKIWLSAVLIILSTSAAMLQPFPLMIMVLAVLGDAGVLDPLDLPAVLPLRAGKRRPADRSAWQSSLSCSASCRNRSRCGRGR